MSLYHPSLERREQARTPVDHPVKLRRPGGRFIVGRAVDRSDGGVLLAMPAGVSFEPGEAVEVVMADAATPAVVRRTNVRWARIVRSLAHRDHVHLALRFDEATSYAKAG